jgi:hypothetical protein
MTEIVNLSHPEWAYSMFLLHKTWQSVWCTEMSLAWSSDRESHANTLFTKIREASPAVTEQLVSLWLAKLRKHGDVSYLLAMVCNVVFCLVWKTKMQICITCD